MIANDIIMSRSNVWPEANVDNELRRRYIRDLLEDLAQVGGANLEQFLKPLWDQLAGSDVQAHGLNPLGSPVAGALDSVWPDGSVSEASSEKGYFTRPFTKIAKDVRHVLKAAPHVRVIHLFSTQVAGPAATTTIQRHKAS